MNSTYTPEICKPSKLRVVDENGKVIEPEYSGTVTMRMPTYEERLEFYDGAGVAFDPTDLTDEAREARNRKLVRHLAKQVRKHFVSSSIVRKSDGFKFDSIETMQYDSDMLGVFTEMGLKLIQKFEVGKDETPISDALGNAPKPS